MKKNFFLIALLSISLGLWAETVNYIDADGVLKTRSNVIEITSQTAFLSGNWYIVKETVTTGSVICISDVHLILADGAKLITTGDSGEAGLRVSGEDNSLTIYGQANQTGQLMATGGNFAAGIGGDNHDKDNAGIVINGGIITAIGGTSAAGIGGGDNGNGINITINRGTVTAIGGDYAAGIGGGAGGSGSNIIINGGTATANAGTSAAGIGGGAKGSGSNITINGGTVTANGGNGGAGIGGGLLRSGSNITINGGTVTATGGEYASGIGGGNYSSGSNIKVASNYMVKAGNNNPPASVIENNGGELAYILNGKQYVTVFFDTLAEYRAAAINEINTAIKDLTLFDAEVKYIDFIKSSILLDEEQEMINMDKKLGFDYIKLHADRLVAISEVKAEMGDLADIETLYKFIGCPAIEGAIDTTRIAQAKSNALAKLKEISTILEDVYARGDSVGYTRGLAAGDSVGYTRGLAAGDSVGYTRGLAEGDSIGYTRGLAAGDSIGYARGDSIGYSRGKTDGKAELLGAMATPCNDCTAVEVKKDTTTLILYAPEQVTYMKK